MRPRPWNPLSHRGRDPQREDKGLCVPGLGPGHRADDVRVSGVRDGEGAHPENNIQKLAFLKLKLF
jgi:hypothetical protein